MSLIVNELYRFRMLMAGVYVGIAISSTYGFSIFTEHLKAKYGFNQSEITTISTTGNCCGYLVFFAGMLFDYSGPKVLLPIAGFLGFLGFLLMGLAFDDVITASSQTTAMIQFCIFNAILYFGCPAMDAATLMPLMSHFPLQRGYMVIIQKTFAGLGTSVLMCYFNGFFRNYTNADASNYSGYAYFVGSQILFCALLGCYFINIPPYAPCAYTRARLSEEGKAERQATLIPFTTQRAPQRRLYIGCSGVAINLLFLTITSIVTGYVVTSGKVYLALAIIEVALLAYFALMALPFQILGRYTPVRRPHQKFPSLGYAQEAGFDDVDAGSQEMPEAGAAPTNGQSSLSGATIEEGVAATDPKKKEASREDVDCDDEEEEGEEVKEVAPPANAFGEPQYSGSFWRHLLTPDLWLFWISFFGMWGTGTVMQMNAAQIYRSKNYGVYDGARLTLYVALIGVGSAMGRIASGVIDMVLTTRRKEGKSKLLTTTFFPIGAILLFFAYLLFAVIPADGLILPFLMGSIGVGFGWGLGALCVRIVYAEDIGKHYNFMFSSGFICTIALNRFMFGEMYDNVAKREGTSPLCNIPGCVQNQMWILMAVNVLATAAAVAVHLRYRRFVSLERRKRRLSEETDPLQGEEVKSDSMPLEAKQSPAEKPAEPVEEEEEHKDVAPASVEPVHEEPGSAFGEEGKRE